MIAATMSDAVAVEYRTMQAIVTDRVRAAILGGQLGPGERVPQDELAQQLGVSRMPVREALRILESEGLVELRPHRGAVVVDLLPEDIAEIFEIRAMLEARAAELAAPNLTDETIARLREIEGEMERATDDEARWLRLNREFHTVIYPASGWPRLCQMIEQQRNVVQPYLRAALAFVGRTRTARDEHREILAAAEARDGQRLGHLTAEHLRTTARELIAFLRRHETPP
jgi:DNA-binding GntR family transcriptional regulator